jgi:hypothetical protein
MLGGYALLLPLFSVVLLAANPTSPSPAAIVAFLIAYLALPLAFAARAAGFGFRRRGWALVASGCVALLALFIIAGPMLAVTVTQRSMGAGLAAMPPGLGGEGMIVQEALPMAAEAPRMAAAQATAMPAAVEMPASVQDTGGQPQEAPLLRQFFPETMYWNPEAITDAGGRWQAEFDLAHTITTWRLTALANAQDGRLGSATAPIRVFQDFFVDIDLPLALTQGDEVSMPVAVHNHLETGQRGTDAGSARLVREQGESGQGLARRRHRGLFHQGHGHGGTLPAGVTAIASR